MKTKDKMIVVSGLAFGLLFYQQDFGVNYLIFSIINLIGAWLVSSREKRNRNWWLSFMGVMLSAVGVFLNGSFIAVAFNMISLFLLMSLSIEAKSSLIISLFHSLYSLTTGVIHLITKFAEKAFEGSEVKNATRRYKHLIIFCTSLVIALIFFFLYRSSNSTFKELTDQIDWSFISVGWIAFTLLGFYVVYWMYRQQHIKSLHNFDITTPNEISDESGEEKSLLSLDSEQFWAKTLLVMLNLLLLTVLIGDVLYFSGLYHFQEYVNFSANVHQGVDALIFSIVLAVGLILFFFKGRLNFIKTSKVVKYLAMFWIIQNAVLVMFTGIRNWEYVEAFFLTYKRIGVFFYLFACLIGLYFTLLKITAIKSNWFLVRKVGWSIYALLLIVPITNWDNLIIDYNFNQAQHNPSHLDLDYLFSLPQENYPHIYSRLENFSGEKSNYLAEKYVRLHSFKETYCEYDWRSFNVKRYLAFKSI